MTAWYLVIYPLSMLLVSILLIQTSVISEQEGSLIYRLSTSVFFLFAVFTKFKEDFDFLLTISTIRRDVFIAQIITALGLSALIGFLVVVEKIIVDQLNQMLGFHNFVDPFYFFSAYRLDSLFLQFIYFWALGFCCAMIGMLLGTLFYRLGKKFTLIFWLVFSALPTIFLPMYLWLLYQRNELGSSMSNVGNYLATFEVPGASGSLLIVAVVVGAATWLNMRRLPQN
jgi:hypothetical protein